MGERMLTKDQKKAVERVKTAHRNRRRLAEMQERHRTAVASLEEATVTVRYADLGVLLDLASRGLQQEQTDV